MQELWVSPHPKRRDNVPEWWTCPCLFSLYPFTASFSTGHLHSGLPCGEPGQAGFALHREKLAALQNKQIRGAFQETHLATSQATLFRSALWVNEADILISGLPPGVTTQFVSSSKVENRHILFWPPQPPMKDRRPWYESVWKKELGSGVTLALKPQGPFCHRALKQCSSHCWSGGLKNRFCLLTSKIHWIPKTHPW